MQFVSRWSSIHTPDSEQTEQFVVRVNIRIWIREVRGWNSDMSTDNLYGVFLWFSSVGPDKFKGTILYEPMHDFFGILYISLFVVQLYSAVFFAVLLTATLNKHTNKRRDSIWHSVLITQLDMYSDTSVN